MKDIRDEASGVIAALATSRIPGRTFVLHPRELAFATKPPTPADTFRVQATGQNTTGAFGRTGTKEDRFQLQVLLGHGPHAGREDDREDFVASDIEKIRDVIEMRVWSASVEGCFFREAGTVRSNRDWWISTIVFDVTYSGAIITS